MSKSNRKPLSLDQLTSFIAAVTKALPLDINPDMAQEWEQNDKALATALRDALCLTPLFEFEYNNYGHIVISITGHSHALTGQQEISRLISKGFQISKWANACLTSKKEDSYDKCHRLQGCDYKIVLVPVKELGRNVTTERGREYGTSFGYEHLLAGAILRIRERVSDEMMEKMRLLYITALHDTITDNDGDPSVLVSHRIGEGQWVGAHSVYPDTKWGDNGAFAFFVPTNQPLCLDHSSST